MITVEEAKSIINSNISDFGTEIVPLKESLGRILREEIVADRDFPPYDRITMDGIALVYDTWKSGINSFPIEGIAPAGATQKTVADPKNCIEVMTGAIMPLGVDTVVPYEMTESGRGRHYTESR